MRDCTCKLGNPPRKTTTKIAECQRHGDKLDRASADLYPDLPETDRLATRAVTPHDVVADFQREHGGSWSDCARYLYGD